MKINQRLFDHYQIDTQKDLRINTVCRRPFDTVLIDKQGSCYPCECTSWLPQSIGNLRLRPLSEIIGGQMHGQVHDTIRDGTYRLCNEHQCPYIRAGTIKPFTADRIANLRLAIDDSCNLRCPSCRDHMTFHKQGKTYDTRTLLADRVNEWLALQEHDVLVHMGSDGDPFASHVYRHFMEHTPIRDNIRYSILTNGLMFSEAHQRVPGVVDRLEVLGVSIDGASRDTYERLRLGGTWAKIQEQMRAIARHHERHGYELRVHMVVQQDNWHEMEMMLAWARDLGVDYLYLDRIQDWNTRLDHSQQTFPSLPGYREMLERVGQDPIAIVDGLS